MRRCPPSPSLLGRQEDLRAVLELLRTSRLVTISGMGGIGKTSLALQARDELDATLVDLQTISEGKAVATVIASNLNIAERSNRPTAEQLVRKLADSDQVLILDNCEHLIADVVDIVSTLLENCPDLRILTTSTERLGLDMEYIHDLEPLGLPEARDSLATVRSADAASLFRARARQVNPDFEITSENRAAVVDICQRLDGLPLAIELAAARMSVLSAGELAKRLDRRFALLTRGSAQRPERHQTLRGLVGWSYEKCLPAEQLLWARLSVFGGAFRLEAAEEVCGFGELDRDEILDLLEGLVVRSVLTVDRHDDRTRYRQLATIRAFGAELLAARGEEDDCRSNLFEFVLGSTRQLVADWGGPDQATALATWRGEHGTTISVLGWAMEDPSRHDRAAELLALLRYHWVSGGWLSSGRHWFDRVLASESLTPRWRGHALAISAWVHMLQGNLDHGGQEVREARAIVTGLDDPQLTAYVETVTGTEHLFRGELPEAVASYRMAIDICLSRGDGAFALSAGFQMAMAQAFHGDDDDALATCAQMLADAEASGEQWNLAYAHWIRGVANFHKGHLAEAEAAVLEALRIQVDFEDGICTAVTLPVLAWVLARSGKRDAAIAVTRAAAAVFDGIGTTPPAFGPQYAREFMAMDERPVPDDAAFQMSTREAAQFGLDIGNGSAPGVPGMPGSDVPGSEMPELSEREREVFAELVEGRSNREIARKLVISQRTAEGHVHRILNKLGLRSRAEVASWYVRGQSTSIA